MNIEEYCKDKSTELIAQLNSVSPRYNEKGVEVLNDVFPWLLDMAKRLNDIDTNKWNGDLIGVYHIEGLLSTINSKSSKSIKVDSYRSAYEHTLDDLHKINKWANGNDISTS